jgi:hypothetical protein
MRNLEKRLEKLEQACTPAEPLVVVLDWITGGKALGVKLSDVAEDKSCVTPMEGESDVELCNRATNLAKEYVRVHQDLRQDYITLRVERDWGPYSDPESEPMPEPVHAPQPTIRPKAQPPRIMTDQGS